MRSILDVDGRCLFCGRRGTERHHVFYGTANRAKSEKYGLTVRLCREHHRGEDGVHFNRQRDLELKRFAQLVFEGLYGHEKFMEVFHKNYL